MSISSLTQYRNPIVEQRADPWVYKHTDAYYYLTASVPEFDRIELRRSKTIQRLGDATPFIAWHRHESGPMSANIWAPEIHFLNEKWYIYFAAASTDSLFNHRMYVLENDNPNPLEGIWIEKGQIKTAWESFSLDETVFSHNGVSYLVWAQKDFEIEGSSNLYIAVLENPWTIKGNQILISKPDYDWEKVGYFVNEGPAILKRNGRIFLTYSASATDHNYCMGMLTASKSSNLLDPNSWSKSSVPIFKTNEETGLYGPGHNSFTISEDGSKDILIYHARNYKELKGDPLSDPNRHTRAQILTWNADGTPNFDGPK